jgi:plasmid maintenance system antidote protein VapI
MTHLANLMTRCGLSLQGAASLLGVSYETIKKWRTGKRNCPARVIDQLEKYADAADRIFGD